MEHMDFYDSYRFLKDHPIFKSKKKMPEGYYVETEDFQESLYMEIVKVDPKTDSVQEDEQLNTEVRVWLEAGPFHEEHGFMHDVDLDAGGATFEEALIELASLVLRKYGDY